MQKWRVLLSGLLLVITGLVVWYLYLRQPPLTPAGLVYNTITQSWEETAGVGDIFQCGLAET